MRALEATQIASKVEIDLTREFDIIKAKAEQGLYCANLGPISEETANSLRALGYKVFRNFPCGPENFLATWPIL